MIRLKLLLFLALVGTLQWVPNFSAHFAHAADPETAHNLDRIAVLSFWAVDQDGSILPQASETDLARLTAVLPQAIAARLVQSGSFEVVEKPDFDIRTLETSPSSRSDLHELDHVDQYLRNGDLDQIIVGNVAQVQQAIITSIRRYTLGSDGPRLVGASVVRSNNASEAVNSVENLLTQVFPPDSDVVLRPISRIVVIPNVLRIPVGESAHIQAYAIDDLGRTLSTVTLVFQTSDETRAFVDLQGKVTGVSPGQAQVNVQPLGRPLAPNVQLPRVDVFVVGPSLGLRAGASMFSGQQGSSQIGLRLTPTHEIRTSTPTQTLPQAESNPVNVLTSFFGSLVGNQMLTVDLDVVPSQDISMTLNAIQRTARSYFGTGVGVTVPLEEGGSSGVILRLTLGTQLPFSWRSNMTHPIEITTDFILGGGQNATKARMGISFGLDLFQ